MKFIGDDGVSIEIKVLGRCDSHSEDYWDANWLKADVKIDVAGFKAFYATNVRVDELQRFYEALLKLVNLNIKEAELVTMEQGLSLSCHANSRGQVECRGKARHQENLLDFKLQTDIPIINNWLSKFDTLLKQYPLIGDFDHEKE